MKIKRTVIKTIVVVAVAAGLLYSAWFSLAWLMMIPDTDAMRVRLLYETDHAALLNACRGLSRRAAAGELKPKTYYFENPVNPETATFGSPILKLEPAYVAVDESGMIMVAMIGGLDHIGVYAYPEGLSEWHFHKLCRME